MGLNCHGWPKKGCNKKVDDAFEILDANKPDLLLLLETAQNEEVKPLSFHDDYEVVLNNPTIEVDNKHSLGKGTSILAKKGSTIEMIFPTWNNDRRTLAICTYENNKKIIIGSFHLDVKEKKCEIEKL